MSAREHLIAYLIMAAMLFYGVAGLIFPELRSWGMFSRAANYRCEAVDARGEKFSFRSHVRKSTFTLSSNLFPLAVASWYLQRNPERSPIKLRIQTIVSSQQKEPKTFLVHKNKFELLENP